MTRRIVGLSVTATSVSAIAIRGRTVEWAARAEHGGDHGNLQDAVERLLGQCPKIRGARVIAALGPSRSKVRSLRGLESVKDRTVATRAVQANIDRFFLLYEQGTVVTPAAAGPKGGWFSAAFAQDVITAVEGACQSLRATLEATVPGFGALPAVLRPVSSPVLPATLTQYADAHYATTAGRTAGLVLASDARLGRSRRRQMWLRRALASAATIAAIASAVAPTFSSERSRRHLAAVLEHERDSLRPIVTTMNELSRVSSQLDRIERSTASRTSMLDALQSLARGLPDSTALLSFRADTAVATIVLLTRSGPAVLQSLTAIPSFARPRVLGAFSREQVSNTTFDRVAVRAELIPAPSRAGRGSPQ